MKKLITKIILAVFTCTVIAQPLCNAAAMPANYLSISGATEHTEGQISLMVKTVNGIPANKSDIKFTYQSEILPDGSFLMTVPFRESDDPSSWRYVFNANGDVCVKTLENSAALAKPADTSYSSFPIALNGAVNGSDSYNVYVDDILVGTRQSVAGVIEADLFNIANGTHKISVSGDESSTVDDIQIKSVSGYEVDINVQKSISVGLADGTSDIAAAAGKKIRVTNNTAEEISGTVIYTVINKNGVMDIYGYEAVTVPAGGTVNTSKAIGAISDANNSVLKVFVIKSYTEPIILSDIKELKGAGYTQPSSDASTSTEDLIAVEVTGVNNNEKKVDIAIKKSKVYSPEIAVFVTKPNGTTIDDIDYVDAVKVTDEKAGITYGFKNTDETASFTVKIAETDVFGNVVTKTDTFKYVGEVTIGSYLDELAVASDVEAVLNKYKKEFRIDMSDKGDFYSLDSECRPGVLAQMNKKFASVDELKSAFDKNVADAALLKKLNECVTVVAVKDIVSVEDNRTALGVKNGTFAMLADDAKEALYGEIKALNTKMYAVTDFAEWINERMALILINSADYTEMGAVLAKLGDVFDISGDYSTLKDTEKELIYVHKALAKVVFEKMSDAVTVFNAAVKKAVGDDSSGSTGSVGTGGGGGGGSVGSSNKPSKPSDTAQGNTGTNNKFNDIDAETWAKEAILFLCEEGVVNGYPDGSFRGGVSVKREEFAKMICTALRIETNSTTEKFVDVKKGDWFFDYVASLTQTGIINGISETEFGTNTELTREDLAVIIYRIISYKNLETDEKAETEYSDFEDISDYAKESVTAISKMGIMNGYDGKFAPKESVTRAMAAKVIYELIK